MYKYQKKQDATTESLIKSIYNRLDLFAQPPAFKILKKDKFTTCIGFCFTLIISILCLVYLLIQFNDLYNQNSPNTIISEDQVADSQPFKLEMANYTLGISMTNLNVVSLSTLNTHFEITVENCKRERILNTTTNKTTIQQKCVNYPTEACGSQHFATQLQQDYFSKIKLGYVQCLNSEMWKTNPPVIQGTPQGMVYQYLMIKVSACKNTTTKTNCASPEEISKELNSGYYVTHLSDNLIQTGKKGSPFQEIINLQYTTSSIASSKTIFQMERIIDSISDVGLISTENVEESKIIQGTYRESQDLYNQEFIISHIINIEARKTTYDRNYMKIQDILGNIGGLWSVLYLVIAGILDPITITLMNLQMANKLFRFQTSNFDSIDEEEDDVNQNKILSARSQISMPVSKRSLRIEQINSEDKMFKFLKSTKNQIQMGVKDVVLMMIGCRKTIKQQIDYASDKVMSKLDVAYIIQKLYEIDKLKHILLSEQQQHLFQYIPKPIIPSQLFEKDFQKKMQSLQQDTAYKFILQDEQTDLHKLQLAFQAYCKISDNLSRSQIDDKILDTLDKDIQELFDSFKGNNIKVQQIFQNSPLNSPQSIDSPSQWNEEDFVEGRNGENERVVASMQIQVNV